MNINPSRINWESLSSYLFINQALLSKADFLKITKLLPDIKGHIWLTSSGRKNLKLVALSKKALLHSALSVNNYLSITPKDKWGLCLPLFHVGGLSILARGYVSHSFVYPFPLRWDAKKLVDFLKQKNITVLSLVPTQVFDLVRLKLLSPLKLRAVVVGGGALSHALYKKARKLHWPLLPSYGLTECSSQVATASLGSLQQNTFPDLKLLPHVKVKIRPSLCKKTKDVSGEIGIQSDSLLTGMVPLSHHPPFRWIDPKEKGWYWTQDEGDIQNGSLKIVKSVLKILGETVNFTALEEKLLPLLLKYSMAGTCVLLPVPDSRAGFTINLVTDNYHFSQLQKIILEFNNQVLSFEKIKTCYFVPMIPQSSLSKVVKPELLKILNLVTKKKI